MSIFIMLNNFFHDFAVALLFVSLFGLSYLYKSSKKDLSRDGMTLYIGIYNYFRKAIWIAWIWIIIGGVIRTMAYEQYEWLPAAGRGQIVALIVKHILLVSLVIWGLVIQTRLRRSMSLYE
ncbi:MAG: hypothetical protein K9N35_03135 [Candidatus Marinimicrobia bacterium]|nr:hypothetical protein [Candidatus Neomarinimicrobiota bacterium]